MKAQEQTQKANLLYVIMMFFCMTPFVFPFPGLETDLQPYALFLSLIVIVIYNRQLSSIFNKNMYLLSLLVPMIIVFVFLVLDNFSMKSFRAAYNHFSVFFVTIAVYMLLNRFGFQEKPFKIILWIWFAVAAIQMFVTKTFLASIIAGSRENAYGRGVVGLCSESSFFGIACFYFLHLANKFQKRRILYLVMITFMAIIFAQSMQGIFFVLVFYVGFILENVRSKNGVFMVIGVIASSVIAYFLLLRIAPESRLIELTNDFINNGFLSTVENDVSATNRWDSMLDAIGKAFNNWLIPQGFDVRFGSGFGGFLVELGIFGLIETTVIAYSFAIHFKSIHTRIIYFFMVYFVFFSNTQIGNPQLLLAIATNIFFNYQEKIHEIEQTNNQQILNSY